MNCTSRLKALNRRNGLCIASDLMVADTALARMKGLLGRRDFLPGEAMWLRPCNWVHTLGMKFALDLIFMGGDNSVVRAMEGVPPNRLSPFVFGARSVLELPAGTVSRTDTRAGDIIEISRASAGCSP